MKLGTINGTSGTTHTITLGYKPTKVYITFTNNVYFYDNRVSTTVFYVYSTNGVTSATLGSAAWGAITLNLISTGFTLKVSGTDYTAYYIATNK